MSAPCDGGRTDAFGDHPCEPGSSGACLACGWTPDVADKLSATLAERRGTHGDFAVNSSISQELKRVMQDAEGWKQLTSIEREALDMIAHKISRALAGDPHFADHWHDMAGYAQLAERSNTD